MYRIHSRLWLCLPPLALLSLDAALTLVGQPAEYWSGDYARVQELNPAAGLLLSWHPLLFIVGVVTIGVMLAAALVFLPERFAYVLCLVAAFLSAAGASSWLVEYGLLGWVLVVLLFWSGERMVTWSWRRASTNE